MTDSAPSSGASEYTMRTFFATTLLLLVLLPAPAALAEVVKPRGPGNTPAPPVGNITFEASLEKAMELGRSRKRVVVAYFTAVWCGYCRRMETLCFSDGEVKSYASKFVWVKIDIDREPAQAARFRVRGVPAFGFLNIRGELLELASGYRSPGQFVDLLKRNFERIESAGQAKIELEGSKRLADQLKKAKRPEEIEKAVLEVVTLLASPDRSHRRNAKAALIAAGRRVWPGLRSCLSDRRLAVRAAAFDLLSEATAREFPFDAFAPLETRVRQVRAWKRWVLENSTPRSKEF